MIIEYIKENNMELLCRYLSELNLEKIYSSKIKKTIDDEIDFAKYEFNKILGKRCYEEMKDKIGK